jgi:hypothetical protein
VSRFSTLRLGLRFSLRGAREGKVRMLLTGLGIALAVALLLMTIGGFNGLNARDRHSGWLQTSGPGDNRRPSVNESMSDPLWWRVSTETFESSSITTVEVAATGPNSPLIPGLDRQPAPGEYYVSPEMAKLLDATPADQLADRFPGHRAGLLGREAVASPVSLIVVVGLTPAQMQDLGATQVKSMESAPKYHDYNELIKVALGIGAIGLMLPVLVFVITSTRLAAARREERLAALRLVGATPGQVSMIAAVEAALAAIAGTALGFVLFYVCRPAAARIPFTGEPFFTTDVSAGWLAIFGVAAGVPLAGVLASLVTLRRVRISPLGVTRQAPARTPRASRLWVPAIGIALLLVPGNLDSDFRNTLVYVIFAIIALGIVIAGPWLTYAGGNLLARGARRDSTLIAARRLSGDPRRSFRAISGLVLAVFVGTVFVTLIGTAMGNRGTVDRPVRDLPGSALAQSLIDVNGDYQSEAATKQLVAKIQGVRGVEAVVSVLVPSLPVALSEGQKSFALSVVLVGAADWERLGGSPDAVNASGYAVVDQNELSQGRLQKVTADQWNQGVAADQDSGQNGANTGAAGVTAPPAFDSLAPDRQNRQAEQLVVLTDGAPGSVERARTAMEMSVVNGSSPYTMTDLDSTGIAFIELLGRLVRVGVILCLIIAGCSLAVSVAGGLVERRRAFALLRLAGMPLRRLYRTVVLEAAVPLVLAAVISAGVGLLVAALIMLTAGGAFHITLPGAGYFGMVLGGLLAALAIVGATLPLMRRMTDPETARAE